MNVINLGKGLGLIKQIIDPTVTTQPVIETPPQKPEFHGSYKKPELTPPEKAGIESEHILSYIRELYNNERVNIHSLVIVRGGKTLVETGFDCRDAGVWQNTFSECKSITSLAIGMLIEEGLLSLTDTLPEIFGKKISPLTKLKFKDITVMNLLNMSTQVMFNEAQCMTTDNWIKGFFNSGAFSEMGKGFMYNSLNTYMLSAIVTEKTGKTMSEYLDKKLFAPLGIKDYYWEKCPRGIDKGGWGLFILPRDMARIGELLLNGGSHNGKQLISKKYIELATTKKNSASEAFGDYDYGFQIWTHRTHPCFLFNGMLGQNMLCFPETGIVIAANAGNADAFQQNDFFEITHRYFARGFEEVLPPDRKAYKKLTKEISTLGRFRPRKNKHFFERLFRKKNNEKYARSICGDYTVTTKERVSTALMPLMMQVVQNNYAKGTLGYSFSIDEKGLCLTCREADSDIRLHIGFDAPSIEQLSILDEKCLTATTGEFRFNEDDMLVLKVRTDLLEYPFTRKMKFTFSGDSLRVEYDELPGRRLIDNFDSSAITNALPSWLSSLTAQGVNNFTAKLASAFEETLYAKKTK